LTHADNFLNRLAKKSAYCVPEARAKAAKFSGRQVDFGVKPRDAVDNKGLVKLLAAHGIRASQTDDGRVRLSGDLARLSEQALTDADTAFHGNVETLGAGHGMHGHEILYYWWIIFDGLTRRFVQEDSVAEANFTKFVTAKVLEPAYNFRQVRAADGRSAVWGMTGLLGFYVIYTLWYGFSLLFVFEGLGIRATESREKKET
jgi:hypothetical protein